MHLALNFQRVDPARGGAETYVADLCRHLIAAGHRVDLYAESWADGCLPRPVNVIPVSGAGRTRLERIWNFARNSEIAISQARSDCSIGFINTWGHDVIIPQGGVQAGSITANSLRFKSSLTRRLYLLGKAANPKYWVYRAIEHRQYSPQRQTRVVAVSKLVKLQLEDFHHIPGQQIHVVPNAIDPERVLVSQPGAVRCAFRNRLGLEPSELVGLFVGHNFALKGLKPLLLALAARRHTERAGRMIHLLICGSGEARPYKELAHRLGIGDAVHFLGFHPDIRACYASSDFFVQPTYYDPCSLVVLEALACGLPVITTAQNGASELMADGREGYILTAPHSQGELVAALRHLTNDNKRREMATLAARLGREQTFGAHVARLTAVFEQVAAAKSRRTPHTPKRGSKSHTPHGQKSRKARR
jgi:UDP-glucose:(heptosyl)LPS alpha-1,3-glucosyltransferase